MAIENIAEDIRISQTNSGAGYLAGLASREVEVCEIEGIVHSINPLTGDVTMLDHLLTRPLRQKTIRTLDTVSSFNEYVKRFKNHESSAYITKNSGGYIITAEIDHRSSAEFVFDDHKASVSLVYSEPMTKWFAMNGKTMSQDQFADLLEERSKEIREPSAADILELAQSLHVTRNLSVKSMVRSNRSHNAISFNQDQGIRGGVDGDVELPTSFAIEVEPFARHRLSTKIVALLRPRIKEDKPVFTYELQLVEEAVEDVLAEIVSQIELQTSLPVYR